MVKHEGGEHAIEGGIRVRELVREAAIESYRKLRSLRFLGRPGERLRVGINAHHLDVRMKLVDQHDESARAATEIERALAGPKGGLIEKSSASLVCAEELHERVVKRQKPIVPGRGQIGPSMFADLLHRGRLDPPSSSLRS